MSDHPKQRIDDRLEEAELSTARFITVKDGEKASIDHEQHEADLVEGNYGIYANGEDQLCILDIDDYGDLDDKSGISALHNLSPTLEQGSPHEGTHRLYRVSPTDDGRLVAAALKDAFGKANLAPSWGEVRVQNQYVVGAGSQLDGCDKDWCDECAKPEGGYYVLQADREIATIDAEELIDTLSADPVLSKKREDDGTADVTDYAAETPDTPDDVDERLSHAREHDDKLDRLMRGDYSDYGGDRSKAEYVLAYKLAFWLGPDKQEIASVLDHDARTQKWAERTDDSYRESVLQGVDDQTEFYEPSQDDDPTFSPDVDWDEVDRGEAILKAEKGVTDPAGGLMHRDGCYGYMFERTDEEGNPYQQFKEVTNFTLETVNFLDTFDGTLMTIRVHPASPLEDHYDVHVKPTAFNDASTFKEEVVRGRTTRYDPQGKHNKALNDLRMTVGAQNAPEYRGTEFIGLHGDTYDEWVTPKGTLTADGWSDEPEYLHHEKGGDRDSQSSLDQKWELDAADGADYDRDEVARICELVPKTRSVERGLPILGWFYAAPMKPLIHDETGEFNLLQVVGPTETGKTSTLELNYQLFGAESSPFGCGDTGFTIEKKLASSCGLPIWLDEYKPTDLPQGKLDYLHRRFREVTREKILPKGRQTLGETTFKFRAPVVFSGEQTVTEAAVRRRTIITNLTTEGKHERPFKLLTGGSYTDANGEQQYAEGLDLHQHALAYYRYILDLSPDDVKEAWRNARDRTREHLDALGMDVDDDSEFQGLQTIAFGVGTFRAFANEMGADADELPGHAEVRDAIEHVAENIGPDGRRREHIDEFTELLSQAASEGYVEPGVHYRVYETQKWGEVLAFHMPTSFSAVKKYVREFNLEDDYTILGKNDYVDGYSDKSDAAETYPLATNHRVREVENGAKCVVIDPERASEVLGDSFNLSTFTGGLPEADDTDGTVLANLDTGRAGELVVNMGGQLEPAEWLEEEGWFVDDDGFAMDYKVREGRGTKSPLSGVPDDARVRVTNAVIKTDRDDLRYVELTPRCDVEVIDGEVSPDSDGGGSSTGEAAADGGIETTSAPEFDDELMEDAVGTQPDAQRLVQLVSMHGAMTKSRLLVLAGNRYDMDPERAKAAFEHATVENNWLVQQPDSDKYTT